jgi:phospholipase C
LNGQRLGQGSFDAIAGSIDEMFDFSGTTPKNGRVVLLNGTTGQVTSD